MFKKPLDAKFLLGLFVSVEQTLFELLRMPPFTSIELSASLVEQTSSSLGAKKMHFSAQVRFDTRPKKCPEIFFIETKK